MVCGQEQPRIHVHTKFEECSFIRYRDIEGVPKLQNWTRTPGHAHLGANLWSAGKNSPESTCKSNKYEECSFIRYRDIEGVPKFRNWARTPGHAHLGANLWSVGKKSPGSMYAPNLKSVASSDTQMLRGSQKFEIRHVLQGTPSWGPICGPRARTAQAPCEHQI